MKNPMQFWPVQINSEVLVKLIDSIQRALGTLYSPRAKMKDADAEAYKIKVIGEAKAYVKNNFEASEIDSVNRIAERLSAEEFDRQQNIDNVIQIAAQDLSLVDNVSSEPVNQDWLKRFFREVRDISDEEVQLLWGKILSEEIKSPNSFSLRTLDALKNFTKEEAEFFLRIANYSFDFHDSSFLIIEEDYLKEKGLYYYNRLRLVEMGVINSFDSSHTFSQALIDKSHNFFTNGSTIYFYYFKDGIDNLTFDVILFTSIGNELLRLITIEEDHDYMNVVFKRLTERGAIIEKAKILSIDSNGGITYDEKERMNF